MENATRWQSPKGKTNRNLFCFKYHSIVKDGIRLQSYNHYKLCIHCKKEIVDYTRSALFSASSNTQKKVSLLTKNEIAQSVKGNLC